MRFTKRCKHQQHKQRWRYSTLPRPFSSSTNRDIWCYSPPWRSLPIMPLLVLDTPMTSHWRRQHKQQPRRHHLSWKYGAPHRPHGRWHNDTVWMESNLQPICPAAPKGSTGECHPQRNVAFRADGSLCLFPMKILKCFKFKLPQTKLKVKAEMYCG